MNIPNIDRYETKTYNLRRILHNMVTYYCRSRLLLNAEAIEYIIGKKDIHNINKRHKLHDGHE